MAHPSAQSPIPVQFSDQGGGGDKLAGDGAFAAQLQPQSLGFTDVNNEPQDLLPNEYKGDNSFYRPNQDTITLGVGGVDDAEDADVTWHEYGHAIHHDQVPGFGQGHDAGSIGEGFAAVSAAIYERAVERGIGTEIPTSWFLEDIRD